ncbi:uncharacterized protein A1O9_03743 [Exophiala aquamarina CBS 119918]|uniref:Methyltransferase type 11 domain-containing protein n=1 Tax=Exophiala aquamarina CBS 119918 TaxID=1182545 RepID=A0A072PTQ4_9EURO|nr:uncharacterized protein A1O9_03743 [Exophiala aquamarina CBS 119918]KEF58900.1 hypothetical protein A1O9_03743 [Exophiala aquamarina CBS 119918]
MSNNMTANGDDWKDLADRLSDSKGNNLQVGITLRRMILRLNERSPFATARGVFDNGCGTGSVISYILDVFGSEIPDSALVSAADFSRHMLEKLRETKEANVAAGKQVWDRLQLHNLDAHDLSTMADGSVSHVTGGHLYFLVSNPRQALEETYRILSKGGVLALSSGKGSQNLDALHDAVEEIRPGTNLQLLQEPWSSEAGVKNELEACGFVDTETFLVDAEIRYETHDDFAKTLLLMPIMKQAIESYTEDEKKRLLVKLVQALRSRNSAEPGTLTGTSIVAFGCRN